MKGCEAVFHATAEKGQGPFFWSQDVIQIYFFCFLSTGSNTTMICQGQTVKKKQCSLSALKGESYCKRHLGQGKAFDRQSPDGTLLSDSDDEHLGGRLTPYKKKSLGEKAPGESRSLSQSKDLIPFNNFYEDIEDPIEPRPYKLEPLMNIKLPFRMAVISASGGGKTNMVMNLIKNIGIFDFIMVFAGDIEEELYQHLKKIYDEIEKIHGVRMLLLTTQYEDLPSIDELNKNSNNLLIIDDKITEKSKELLRVAEWFTRGRKKQCSTIFISQSFFMIPMIIRANCNYLVLKKIASSKDVKRMMGERSIEMSPEELMVLYKKAMADNPFKSFLLIDSNTPNPALKVRDGYLPFSN